jgi:hypothetical protein
MSSQGGTAGSFNVTANGIEHSMKEARKIIAIREIFLNKIEEIL